jgi:outer membrane cobalamin receptor
MLHRTKFIAQAEVNNLLDQDYEVIVNYPMPGINYALSLTVEI